MREGPVGPVAPSRRGLGGFSCGTATGTSAKTPLSIRVQKGQVDLYISVQQYRHRKEEATVRAELELCTYANFYDRYERATNIAGKTAIVCVGILNTASFQGVNHGGGVLGVYFTLNAMIYTDAALSKPALREFAGSSSTHVYGKPLVTPRFEI